MAAGGEPANAGGRTTFFSTVTGALQATDWVGRIPSLPGDLFKSIKRERRTTVAGYPDEFFGEPPSRMRNDSDLGFGYVHGQGGGCAAAWGGGGGASSSSSAAVGSAYARASEVGGAAALLEKAQKLRVDIAKEQEIRRIRAAELGGLDGALRGLREKLVAERSLMVDAEGERLIAHRRSDAAENELEELQERHHSLLGRRAQLEAELRRHQIAAALAEHAAQKATRDGAWARDGPEMEALKDAKIELAEVLTLVDEARLQSRRELAEMMRNLEDAQAESVNLQPPSASGAGHDSSAGGDSSSVPTRGRSMLGLLTSWA